MDFNKKTQGLELTVRGSADLGCHREQVLKAHQRGESDEPVPDVELGENEIAAFAATPNANPGVATGG